jgi:hypothetical protein
VGQFHTLDLELNRNFTLEKAEGWDSISRQIVRDACDVQKGASAWAVVMQEGIANIAVLMGERTVLRQRVAVPVPGKKGGEKAHAKVYVASAHQHHHLPERLAEFTRPSINSSKPPWRHSYDTLTSMHPYPFFSPVLDSPPVLFKNTFLTPQPGPGTNHWLPRKTIC